MGLGKGSSLLTSVLAGMVLFLGGCAGVRYRMADTGGEGWQDKQLSLDSFSIRYAADGYNQALYCATYHAAEVTYQHKFRYFQVTKTENLSKIYHTAGVNGGDGSDNYLGVARIYIKCFHDKPNNNEKTWHDSHNIFEIEKVPFESDYYTLDQRKADEKKGIHSWQERMEDNNR